MPSPTEITVSQLARLVGTPEAPAIVDVRIDADFDQDPQLIPTAFRHPFDSIETIAPSLTGRSVVVYCQKGKKISQGAAALLRAEGVRAETLMGGQFAWRDAELPLVPGSKIPISGGQMRSIWVTRHRPKVDRIACPWLLRRFVDPEARFLFVAPSEVMEVADKFDAQPFDMDDEFWSHRGSGCTFDTMIEEFNLSFAPLQRMAAIVRGADTNQHQLAPQAAGLLAVSLGLSRMYRDDLEQLEASMPVYDALYRWCRDATNEGHDWPPHTAAKK